jgi:hypothetical protein
MYLMINGNLFWRKKALFFSKKAKKKINNSLLFFIKIKSYF